jgi:hypothetical protein
VTSPDLLVWTDSADHLYGRAFENFQTELAKYNARQLIPGFPSETWREDIV